jgi:hypothetical protein
MTKCQLKCEFCLSDCLCASEFPYLEIAHCGRPNSEAALCDPECVCVDKTSRLGEEIREPNSRQSDERVEGIPSKGVKHSDSLFLFERVSGRAHTSDSSREGIMGRIESEESSGRSFELPKNSTIEHDPSNILEGIKVAEGYKYEPIQTQSMKQSTYVRIKAESETWTRDYLANGKSDLAEKVTESIGIGANHVVVDVATDLNDFLSDKPAKTTNGITKPARMADGNWERLT